MHNQSLDLTDLLALARVHGFSFEEHVDLDAWLIPISYLNLPVLSYTAKEMDFPHDPHPLMNYLGPMTGHGRAGAEVEKAGIQDLGSFLDGRDDSHISRPLIYCSLGAFWSTEVSFLQRVISVFRRRKDWDLVIGFGGKLDPEELAPLPTNVLALAYAPQILVLSVSACMITHGGIGSINECVSNCVPMVIYSTKHGDKIGCAAHVAIHKLGVAGDKGRDDDGTIEELIDQVINDSAIAIALNQMHSHFKRYDSQDNATALANRLLRGELAHQRRRYDRQHAL